jgi:hypothetical protein
LSRYRARDRRISHLFALGGLQESRKNLLGVKTCPTGSLPLWVAGNAGNWDTRTAPEAGNLSRHEWGCGTHRAPKLEITSRMPVSAPGFSADMSEDAPPAAVPPRFRKLPILSRNDGLEAILPAFFCVTSRSVLM